MKSIAMDGSDNGPSFDVALENELLILKLKAEFGAECTSNSSDLPPEVVNEFLQSVYYFEQSFREPHDMIKVYDKIGRPPFRKAQDIPDIDIARELKYVRQLLSCHQLEVDVLAEYADRQIYQFITEEFFHHDIDNIQIQGYIHHFCYEDFHPNYELEIRQRSVEFITQWFARTLGDYSWQLADPFIHPDSREFSKPAILKKIRFLFDAYENFSQGMYSIDEVKFNWDDKHQTGTGYVRGVVSYLAHTESGEVVPYDGPFEFYLSNSGTWWNIFYFVFPGFAWQ
jgi:hypothetical protein